MPGIEFKVIPIHGQSGDGLLMHVESGVNELVPEAPIILPVVETIRGLFSSFKSSTRTTAGTTIIAQPFSSGSLLIVDLLISADRVNGASVIVQFADGSNTVTMFKAALTDAPVNLATSFAGRWQGWKDARFEMVTVGITDATVAVSYVKIRNSLTFAEWDSFR